MGTFGANYGANYDLGIVVSGVQIQGSHATQLIGRPKPRIIEYKLTSSGKILRNNIFRATARIQRITEFFTSSKIFRETSHIARSKITKLYDYIAEAKTYQRIYKNYIFQAEATTYQKDQDKETNWRRQHTIDQHIRESKKSKISKLFDIYKQLDDYSSL